MHGLTDTDALRSRQNEKELAAFIDLLRREGVTSYLEVGALYGLTFDAVMRSLPKGSSGIALDFPGGPNGDSRTALPLLTVVERLRADGYDADCLLGPSEAEVIQRRARLHAPYDALLIDADHAYEAVSRNWRNYGAMARIVAFHDIAAHDHAVTTRRRLPIEVPRAWREIVGSGLYRTVEIVEPGSELGIGVVLQ